MESFVSLFRSNKGEVATILTLISVLLMFVGATVGSYVAQKETKIQTKAVDSTKVQAQNISNYCLGDIGIEGSAATSFCLPWGTQISMGVGKSVGNTYCCQICNPETDVWSNTCYRPVDQNKNTRGPGENTCETNAGVAFPLKCLQDPIDKKWKWTSQNHYGECNVLCATEEVIPTMTKEPSNTPVPIENTPTIDPIVEDCNISGRWICTIGSWTNCLGPGVGKQDLFNTTYCNGELMWKYQAALAHGAKGDACDGLEQKLRSEGCASQPPTDTPTLIPNQPSNMPTLTNTPTPASSEIPTPTATPTPRQGGPVPSPTDTPASPNEQKIYCHSCIGEDNGTCNERILKKSDNQTCQGVYMQEGGCYSFTCPKNTPTPPNEQKIYCHSCIGVDKDICDERVLLESENRTCQGVYMEEGGCYVSTCKKPLVIEDPNPTPTNTPTFTPTETPTPTPFINSAIPLCKFIDGGDQANPNGKLNIVLIADGFTDLNEFLDIAAKQVKLMSLSGLKEEEVYYKMNFWANTTLNNGMLHINPITKLGWDIIKGTILMSNCNGQAFVIISKSFTPDVVGVGGLAILNGNSAIVHASYIGALAHELGHAINGVGLADEYFPVFAFEFLDYPNCSKEPAEKSTFPCRKWKYLNDDETECFPGCSLVNWFRPTDNSIMRRWSSDPNNPVKFNRPSLEAWKKGLEKYRL